MRVLVMGGTGLIGRALAANLSADGHQVILFGRSPERAKGLPKGVHAERWDARTAAGWAHLADGADAIVNLAGASLAGEGLLPTRWTPERKQLLRDSRVNAGRAVVEAVRQVTVKPRVVIQASAIGVYGAHQDEEITEDAPPGDDALAQMAATEWEPSTAGVEEMGVRRAIIRFLIENERASGPYNLTSPKPLPYAEFGRVLGRVLRRPSLIPVPAFAMKMAFGEVSSVLLEGRRVIPKRLLDLGFTFRFPDADAALRDLLR